MIYMLVTHHINNKYIYHYHLVNDKNYLNVYNNYDKKASLDFSEKWIFKGIMDRYGRVTKLDIKELLEYDLMYKNGIGKYAVLAKDHNSENIWCTERIVKVYEYKGE